MYASYVLKLLIATRSRYFRLQYLVGTIAAAGKPSGLCSAKECEAKLASFAAVQFGSRLA